MTSEGGLDRNYSFNSKDKAQVGLKAKAAEACTS